MDRDDPVDVEALLLRHPGQVGAVVAAVDDGDLEMPRRADRLRRGAVPTADRTSARTASWSVSAGVELHEHRVVGGDHAADVVRRA